MLGRRDRSKRSLFIAGDIEQFIPDDHILKRVDRFLDLSWLRKSVKDCIVWTTDARVLILRQPCDGCSPFSCRELFMIVN